MKKKLLDLAFDSRGYKPVVVVAQVPGCKLLSGLKNKPLNERQMNKAVRGIVAMCEEHGIDRRCLGRELVRLGVKLRGSRIPNCPEVVFIEDMGKRRPCGNPFDTPVPDAPGRRVYTSSAGIRFHLKRLARAAGYKLVAFGSDDDKGKLLAVGGEKVFGAGWSWERARDAAFAAVRAHAEQQRKDGMFLVGYPLANGGGTGPHSPT